MPGMTLDDAIASFAAPGDLPRNGMRWALDHWDEAGPRFLAMLDAYARGEDRSAQTEGALFITVHLQAERRDTAAFAPLCRLLRDGEAASLVLGDAITETLPRVLVSLCDGDLPALAGVVEAAQTDDFIRTAALDAMAYLTHAGQVPEADMRACLLRWLDELEQRESYVWVGWVMAVTRLGWADLMPQAEELLRRGFVDPDIMGVEHLREDLRRTLDDPRRVIGFAADGIGPFGRAEEELDEWENTPPPDSADEPDWEPPTMPITNPLRGVGRNDPCPCGSGKKYKKCCLV